MKTIEDFDVVQTEMYGIFKLVRPISVKSVVKFAFEFCGKGCAFAYTRVGDNVNIYYLIVNASSEDIRSLRISRDLSICHSDLTVDHMVCS